MIKTKEEISEDFPKFLYENDLNLYESGRKIIMAHASDEFYIQLNEWIYEE